MEIIVVIVVIVFIIATSGPSAQDRAEKELYRQRGLFYDFQKKEEEICLNRTGTQTKLFYSFYTVYAKIFRVYQSSESKKFHNTLKYDFDNFGSRTNIDHYGPAINLLRFGANKKPLPATQYTENEMTSFLEADKKFHEDRNRRIENSRIQRERDEEQKNRMETIRLESLEREKQRIKASTAGKLIDKSIQRVENEICNYSGVYLIVNNKTLDFYIGESQNISFRRLTHLGQMSAPEKHHRPLIQKHYEQYGASSFDFYVLERVNNDTKEGIARKRIEEFYIKEYNPTYNSDY